MTPIAKKSIIIFTLLAAIAGGIYVKIHLTRTATAQKTPSIPDLSAHPKTLTEAIFSIYSSLELGISPKKAIGKLAKLYHSNGYIDQAIECYDLLMELDSDSGKWPHLKATILSGYGRSKEASEHWDLSIARNGAYFSARAQLGNALIKLESWSPARTVFKSALEIWPDEPYALVGIGRVEYESGNLEAARGYLEQAARVSQFKIGIDLLTSVYHRLGDPKRAQALLGATAIGSYPQLPDPWLLEIYEYCFDSYQLSVAGGHAAHAGDLDAGTRLLQRAIKLDPGNPMIYYQLSSLYIENGNLTSAESSLQSSIRLSPKFSDGWIQLFELYRKKGDRSSAINTLARGYKNCPDSPGIALELADMKSEAKQWEEAIGLYQKSIHLRPNEAGAYLGLARAYSSLNRPQESIAEIEKALQYEPAHPSALSSVAFWAILTNDRVKAEHYMKRIDAQPRVPTDDKRQLLQKFRDQFGTAYQPSD